MALPAVCLVGWQVAQGGSAVDILLYARWQCCKKGLVLYIFIYNKMDPKMSGLGLMYVCPSFKLIFNLPLLKIIVFFYLRSPVAARSVLVFNDIVRSAQVIQSQQKV